MKKIYILLFAVSFLIPCVTQASELRLDTSKLDVHVGEEFIVEINMGADEFVNALEGQIVFLNEALEIHEIRDGNTAINFWIEKPRGESGIISFAGITPGGFTGANKHIFSVVFEAKHEGVATISFSDATALENDGLGTEVSLALRNVVIDIKPGDSSVRKSVVDDFVQPEPFSAVVAQNPLLHENKSVAVFSTHDKDSGIAYYEVKEYRFKPFSLFSSWNRTPSPYVLSDQELRSHVFIRAVDNAGNVQVSEISPANPLSVYEYVVYWLVFLGIPVMLGYVLYWILRRYRRARVQQ